MKNINFFNKKGIVSEALPWIVISLAILVILTLSVFIFKDKGIGFIDKLGGIFKGR